MPNRSRVSDVSEPLLEALARNPLIAILRAPDASAFGQVTATLYEAGFRCVEFTLTSSGAISALQEVRSSMPDDLLVGIGTVRTADQVQQAVDAGAAFLVSQVFRRPLVDAAAVRGVPFFPGALTPTEILDAWESGVPAVKVSPIGPVGGLAYFENVRGPLPDIPLLPTGGVELHEVSAYLERGAVAVGLSGALMGDALMASGDLAALADRAQQVVNAIGPR
jgi:2-dehydro-3-deoxyphosphogluconate aldolase/(4S)-4-hydroxy-2-oxoglutarate aldolase